MDKELTQEQEAKMIEFWNSHQENPPGLKELTSHIFGDGFDGRSIESQAIRRALAKQGWPVFTTTDPISKTDKIELSESHKQYIKNFVATMNALEMSKNIFANPRLTNLSAETRAVNKYIKELNPASLFSENHVNDVPMSDYSYPATFDEAFKRINTYIIFVPDRKKITASQKRCVEMMIAYLSTYRFIAQMNNYETMSERKIAEDAFIRATYDKPDLMQEELDQYIEYANHVVQGFNIQRRSNNLQKILDNMASGDEPEKMKIAMSFVEAIGKASTEYNLCKKREQDLLSSLKEERSSRLSKQLSDNASILNLVQAWKSEEGRAEMNKHAEKEQAAVANEIDRLSSLPDMKARIMGGNKEGVLNG